MNPRDDQAAPVPQDLDSAYRALPPAAPAAVLDAQVRAAVGAELAASPGHRRGLLAGLRQRMPLVSLATAATVLVAVAVGYLALPHYRTAEALRPVPAAPDTTVATTLNREPAGDSVGSSALADVESSVTVAPSKPLAGRLQAPVQITAPPASYSAPAAAPEAPSAEAPAAAASAIAPPAKEEARVVGLTARPTDSLEEIVVTESRKATSPQAEQMDRFYGRSGQLRAVAPVTLDAVRALLHDGKRRAARKLLQRWQLQNRDASVPGDLQALLDKAP
jgi:hypothetical protein